jgi:hypothetical protein
MSRQRRYQLPPAEALSDEGALLDCIGSGVSDEADERLAALEPNPKRVE